MDWTDIVWATLDAIPAAAGYLLLGILILGGLVGVCGLLALFIWGRR